MEALIEQLDIHYYRIRDHLEKPQAVAGEIAKNINEKVFARFSIYRVYTLKRAFWIFNNFRLTEPIKMILVSNCSQVVGI